MKTKYIKVKTADRLPEKSGIYIVDGFKFAFFNGIEFLRFNEVAQVEWWLFEVPDREEEMSEMLEKIYNIENKEFGKSSFNIEDLKRKIKRVLEF